MPSVRKNPHRNLSKDMISDVELLREYRRIQILLGRFPNTNDLVRVGQYHPSTYTRRFGSWEAVREMMGDRSPVNGGLSKADLIANYLAVSEELGRAPTGKELATHGRYGVRTYHKYFGGVMKLREFLGDPLTVPAQPRERKALNAEVKKKHEQPSTNTSASTESLRTLEQHRILSRFGVWKRWLGRPLTVAEGVTLGVWIEEDINLHFGTTVAFREACYKLNALVDATPPRPMSARQRQILVTYCELKHRCGGYVTRIQAIRNGVCGTTEFIDEFGGYDRFLSMIAPGFPSTKRK